MKKYSPIAKVFFDDIFADNPFDGYVIFYTRNKFWNDEKNKYDYKMHKSWYCKTSEVHKYISALKINPNLDYYFTLNSYKNPKGKENIPTNRKNLLFGFNGICIDVDCHYENRLIEKDFDDVINLIDTYTYKNKLPHYSYIIKTGRGLHIYYLFKPCSSKLGFLVDMAKNILIDHYKKIVLPMPQFSIDAGASKRYSGIYRMPYTVNQATKTESEIKYWEVPYKLDINDFLEQLLVNADNNSTTINFVPSTFVNDCSDNPPNIARCNKVLREVQKYQYDIINKNSGHENRNRTCLIYTSFLLNVYPPEVAFSMLKDFNRHYHLPLSNQRLQTIFAYLQENYTDKSKAACRYISNAKILEMLEITSGQYDIIVTDNYKYHSFVSKISTDEQKKRKKEKANKRKRATELLKDGYKYSDISKLTGLSISTISRLNKSLCPTTEKIKDTRPWEQLGISRATYYRHKKWDFFSFI